MDQKSLTEEKLRNIMSSELAKLNFDYKKARDEYPEAVEPIIRTFGLYKGPFRDNQMRIKKRYVKK
jgi:hypothetical protein